MTRLIGILLIVALIQCLVSCATQTTPQGGPKDEQPPILLKSSPAQNERNFHGKSVQLTFHELVKLNNASDEIIITPSLGKEIEYVAKQYKISIEPKDGWKENTTYSISFREGVQDITESNPADTLHLAFSTGPDIDSLVIMGHIKNAILETIPEKITVAIYQSDTTDIFKHGATYFTKTDKEGFFKISNLKAGKYFIYAFDDRNKNLKVESTTEVFGFKKDSIILGKESPDSILISLAKADSRRLKINSVRRTDKTTKVIFNKSITSYTAKPEINDTIINSFGDNKSEIFFYNPQLDNDSIKINITAKDSITQSLDSVIYIKKSTVKALTETFRASYSEPIFTSETSTLTLKGTFSKPIREINLDSIYVKLDSLTNIPIQEGDITIDNINKLISLNKKLDKKALDNENIFPEILLGKAFLLTYENDSSKAEKRSIKKLLPEKTATLEIQIKTSKTHTIIQLLNSSGAVLESIRNQKNYTFKNLEPTSYKLRVILDENNNGAWDVGSIYTRTEPEPVYYYKSQEGNFEIMTRENSDIGPLILSF